MGDVDNIEGDENPDLYFESESFMIEPMDLHPPQKENNEQNNIRNIYTCPLDEETFTTIEDYNKHMNEHADEVTI